MKIVLNFASLKKQIIIKSILFVLLQKEMKLTLNIITY